jgi:hypothetical protein
MSKVFLYAGTATSGAVKEPAIAMRIAQAWLVLGCLGVLCVPALRERSEWIGWLPLWLVLIPLAELAILRWRSLLIASHKAWRRFSHRRVESAPRRARCVRKAARPRRIERRGGTLLAAFLFR